MFFFFFFCKATIGRDEYHFDNHEIGDLGVSSLRFVCLFVSLLAAGIRALFTKSVFQPHKLSVLQHSAGPIQHE